MYVSELLYATTFSPCTHSCTLSFQELHSLPLCNLNGCECFTDPVNYDIWGCLGSMEKLKSAVNRASQRLELDPFGTHATPCLNHGLSRVKHGLVMGWSRVIWRPGVHVLKAISRVTVVKSRVNMGKTWVGHGLITGKPWVSGTSTAETPIFLEKVYSFL